MNQSLKYLFYRLNVLVLHGSDGLSIDLMCYLLTIFTTSVTA